MPVVSLSSLLTGLTPEEKEDRKAQALAALVRDGSFAVGPNSVVATPFTQFTLNGVTIVMDGVAYLRDIQAFSLKLTASDANGPLPTSNQRYLFKNPPILHGGVEDIVGAVQQMIYEEVVDYARNRGWSG